MITEKQLYKLVKDKLPSGYDLVPRFGFAKVTEKIDERRINIINNTISVYFKSGTKPFRVASGRYLMNNRRIVYNLYTSKASDSSVALGYEILSKIKDNMLSLQNCEVNIGTVSDPEYIGIIDCELTVDSNYIGMTEQGQAIFSLELKITY